MRHPSLRAQGQRRSKLREAPQNHEGAKTRVVQMEDDLMPKRDTFWEKVAEIKGVKFYSRKHQKRKKSKEDK
jgi:hypothetical protein